MTSDKKRLAAFEGRLEYVAGWGYVMPPDPGEPEELTYARHWLIAKFREERPMSDSKRSPELLRMLEEYHAMKARWEETKAPARTKRTAKKRKAS